MSRHIGRTSRRGPETTVLVELHLLLLLLLLLQVAQETYWARSKIDPPALCRVVKPLRPHYRKEE